MEMERAVDLIIEEDKSGNGEHKILIRADPDKMSIALAADDVLTELVPARARCDSSTCETRRSVTP